jgi:hypothetical protein
MQVRISATMVVAIFVVAISLLSAPAVFAQVWDHRTVVTVDKPFEVPGAILPSGTYVFRIVDIAANRTVFRIMSEDETVHYATVMGIPDLRMKPSDETDLTFYESAPGEPAPLRTWFYSGYQHGLEFVYPNRRAVEIARTSGEHVIARKAEPEVVRAKPEPTPEELFTEPLVAIEPSGEPVEIAAVHPEAMEPPAQVETGLPRTATGYPLVGLIGLFLAAGALGIRLYR